ncbi:MAG: beta strand repeat-containing protein, partial [Isosphaeraceae bacterium]
MSNVAATGITRTLAWHEYEIIDTPQALSIVLDGTTVYTTAGGTPFDSVTLEMFAPGFRPSWTSYYDDFEFVPDFVVTSLADSGPGSLRDVIDEVNTDPIANGADQITFAPGISGGTIAPQSPLPPITRNQVTVVGPITLDGTSAGGDGLDISGNQDSVQNVTVESFSGNGVSITGNNDSVTGSQITGDQNGIVVSAGATGNTIGGTVSGTQNTIANNFGAGVHLQGAQQTVVQGNWIGTDSSGDTGLGNSGDGIDVFNGATANTIGGTVLGAGNTIANNHGNGVTIGSSPTDASAGDSVLENAIYGNAKIGIDLGDDGVTLNDSKGHSGPNLFQDFPLLASAFSVNGTTLIAGSLSADPNTMYRVEFYGDPNEDPSGHGQGQTFLGFANVTTGTNGVASFTDDVAVAVPVGQFVSATATDPDNDTSEFSADVPVQSGYLVTNTNDSGSGSLRQAILSADANDSVANTIVFNIPETDPGYANGVFTIQPLSQLPVLGQNITIDGTTQTAFTGNTNPYGPVIVLNGAKQPTGDGLELDDDNTVEGLVIDGFAGGGISLSWAFSSGGVSNNNRILNNYIGTDATGTSAVPNNFGIGIVGYGSPSEQSANNVIQGNLISGNLSFGIGLGDTTLTQITDNLIGTDRTGASNLGNGAEGISLGNAGCPSNTIIGNTIAFNKGDGIVDAPDYRYSVAYTPQGHQGNAFLQNSIFSNGMLGIDLVAPGTGGNVQAPWGVPLQNTPGGPHQGANLLQNYPVLNTAISTASSTVITGSLNSTPSETFHLEFFASPTANASGYGEGKTYLGDTLVTTDAAGNASFTVTVPVGNLVGQVLSSTATDAGNNTSEFSKDIYIQSGYLVTNTNDSGPGSLRQAIAYAELLSGNETVMFDPTVFSTPQTITLTSGQLNLTDATGTLTIQGPGANLLSVNGNNASRVFYLPYSNEGDSASLDGLTVSGGSASNGGGLDNNFGTLTLANCTVSGNSANGVNQVTPGDGGGVCNVGGSVTLTNCTISGNTTNGVNGFAGGQGGGLFNHDGIDTLTNCTVSGNSATYGGGLYNENGVTLTDCTVSGNSATYGGGLFAGLGAATLNNTIVAGNTGGDTYGSYFGSNNFIGGIPLLAALGNYGGPSQTMPPLPGSPVIGAGSTALIPTGITTDQRGEPRTVNGSVDIGAVQSQGYTLTPATGSTPQTAVASTEFANPLAVRVTPNYASDPVNGGVITFTAPTSGASATLSAASATITNGGAAVTATANATAGSYVVSASAVGVSTPASFHLTNTPSLPSWLATGSAATWNAGTKTLSVTGAATITADPGSDAPNIVASGAAAVLTIQPITVGFVNLGGITLTGGASIIVPSVGAARTHTYHNVIVLDSNGTTVPTFSIDSSSKLDMGDNDLIIQN